MTSYFHTLLEQGGHLVLSGETVLESDFQVHGHLNNTATSPPEKQWIGWKVIPIPHPTFIRLPDEAQGNK
jgi:hypothetical protein